MEIIEKNKDFGHDANVLRDKRESIGIGDRFTEIQPMSQPKIDKSLIGRRLDVCEQYDLEEGGTELRWSQGVVIAISDGNNMLKPGARTAKFKLGESVMIKWDANPDRNELSSTSAQRLLKKMELKRKA